MVLSKVIFHLLPDGFTCGTLHVVQHMYIYIYIYISLSLSRSLLGGGNIYIYVYKYVYIYVYIYVYMSILVSTYVIYMSTYIYIYITNRECNILQSPACFYTNLQPASAINCSVLGRLKVGGPRS